MPSPNEPRARPVGAIQLLALGLNGIVGVGIFVVPASVAASAPGLGAVAVFALTGLALLPAAVTFATLGRRFDEDGGPVVFARAAFGDRVSFLVGWVAYVSALFSTAAVVVGLTRATLPALDIGASLAARAAPALLVTLLAAVVASGLRLSARVWTSLTALKLLPLILLVGAFALAWGRFPGCSRETPFTGGCRRSRGGPCAAPRPGLVDDRDPARQVDVARVAVATSVEKTVIDLVDDLQVARQHALEEAHRPGLQRLGQQRVVGVAEHADGDVPGPVPVQAVWSIRMRISSGIASEGWVSLSWIATFSGSSSKRCGAWVAERMSCSEALTKKYSCMRRSSRPISVVSSGRARARGSPSGSSPGRR